MASAEATARYPYPIEDPATLRTQQRTIGNLGLLLRDSYADVDDSVLTLAGSWRSDTATTAVADVKVLGADLWGDSTVLATAADAVGRYVRHVDDARTDVDDIRRRYDAAVAVRDHANALIPPNVDTEQDRVAARHDNQVAFEQKRSGLDGEHGTVLSTLRTQSASSVTDLDAALTRFVGPSPPAGGSLGEVAFQHSSLDLSLTGDTVYEFVLRQSGLLSGASPQGYYQEWLQNAQKRGIDPYVIASIVLNNDITAEDFSVLDGWTAVQDPDGWTYFQVPPGTSGDDARKAVLMTYILNCGTGYDEAGEQAGITNDFTETPYSSAEVQRIIHRQGENSWSYDEDVGFVQSNGGRLMTTPNGMLMGLGGNWLQDRYSLNGGTTFGDIFMLNIDGPRGDAAAAMLQQVAESGSAWYEDDNGPYQGSLDLDRLLHHEERHSQQWARLGYAEFLAAYGGAEVWTWLPWTGPNHFEADAGLEDGGY